MGLGLRRTGRHGPVYDARAKTLFDFWDGVGAPATHGVKGLYNDTIVALQDTGIWADADLIAFTAAVNTIQAMTDIKNPEAGKVFTLSNSPTITERYGVTGNGSSSYLGTWLVPASNGNRWSVNSASVWSFTDTNAAASVPDVGAGETYAAYCISRGVTDQMGGLINRVSGATTTAAAGSSAGLTGIQRIDATTERLNRDGVQQGSDATVAVAGRPTGQFRICGRSPSTYSPRRVGFAMAGASMADKEADINTIVQDFIARIKVV